MLNLSGLSIQYMEAVKNRFLNQNAYSCSMRYRPKSCLPLTHTAMEQNTILVVNAMCPAPYIHTTSLCVAMSIDWLTENKIGIQRLPVKTAFNDKTVHCYTCLFLSFLCYLVDLDPLVNRFFLLFLSVKSFQRFSEKFRSVKWWALLFFTLKIKAYKQTTVCFSFPFTLVVYTLQA